MLREIADGLPSSDQLDATRATLDTRNDQLQSRQKETDALLAAAPTALEIREEENYWRTVQKETAATRRELLDWANAAQIGSSAIAGAATTVECHARREQVDTWPGPNSGCDPAIRYRTCISSRCRRKTNCCVLVNLQVRAASQDQLALMSRYRLNKDAARPG